MHKGAIVGASMSAVIFAVTVWAEEVDFAHPYFLEMCSYSSSSSCYSSAYAERFYVNDFEYDESIECEGATGNGCDVYLVEGPFSSIELIDAYVYMEDDTCWYFTSAYYWDPVDESWEPGDDDSSWDYSQTYNYSGYDIIHRKEYDSSGDGLPANWNYSELYEPIVRFSFRCDDYFPPHSRHVEVWYWQFGE